MTDPQDPGPLCTCGHPRSEHNLPGANYYDVELIEGACIDESNGNNNFDGCHAFVAAPEPSHRLDCSRRRGFTPTTKQVRDEYIGNSSPAAGDEFDRWLRSVHNPDAELAAAQLKLEEAEQLIVELGDQIDRLGHEADNRERMHANRVRRDETVRIMRAKLSTEYRRGAIYARGLRSIEALTEPNVVRHNETTQQAVRGLIASVRRELDRQESRRS